VYVYIVLFIVWIIEISLICYYVNLSIIANDIDVEDTFYLALRSMQDYICRIVLSKEIDQICVCTIDQTYCLVDYEIYASEQCEIFAMFDIHLTS